MTIGGRYVSLFLMACGYAGEYETSNLFTKQTSDISGFAMTLVWVSSAVPRPPAYVIQI